MIKQITPIEFSTHLLTLLKMQGHRESNLRGTKYRDPFRKLVTTANKGEIKISDNGLEILAELAGIKITIEKKITILK